MIFISIFKSIKTNDLINFTNLRLPPFIPGIKLDPHPGEFTTFLFIEHLSEASIKLQQPGIFGKVDRLDDGEMDE